LTFDDFTHPFEVQIARESDIIAACSTKHNVHNRFFSNLSAVENRRTLSYSRQRQVLSFRKKGCTTTRDSNKNLKSSDLFALVNDYAAGKVEFKQRCDAAPAQEGGTS